MSDEKKNDLPKDPVNGPITERPTEPKSEVEIAQEDGQVTHHASVDGPVVVAQRHGMFGSSLGNDTSGYGGLERPIIFPGATPRPYGGWFDQLADLVPHHVVSTDVPAAVAGRAVLVERLEMLPVECVARAYLTGGGLGEYQATGAVSGIELPAGLVDGSPLPEPIFTPSTKAPVGEHDEPIPYSGVVAEIGEDLASRVRDLTVRILQRGNEIATDRGIILADTKVEFGMRGDEIVLADEVLTPDSSRFWPADQWEPGRQQPSYDKQYVRDWLTSPASGWDKSSGEAPPALPEAVVAQTRAKYVEAYERLTGQTFSV